MMKYCREVIFLAKGFSYGDFIEDFRTHRACVLSIFQIGELTKKLSDDLKEVHHYIPWRGIVAVRNFIAHDYEDLDWQIIWMAIQESVPELLVYLEKILIELNMKGDK